MTNSRWRTGIVVVLAAGCILNVAAALVLSAMAQEAEWVPRLLIRLYHTASPAQVQSTEDWPQWSKVRVESFGYTRVFWFRAVDESREHTRQTRSGWPLKSLSATTTVHLTASEVDVSQNMMDSQWADVQTFLEAVDVPVRPIWSGFVINSLLYAAVLMIGIALPRHLRRRLRIRRGLCLTCAYPLGRHERCTECGERRSATRI